jgi:putative peptide zinc metalloprotease protein
MSAAAALPSLRDELSLHPGPIDADGSPTWTLRDPVRHRFFRLGWAAFEILARWQAGGVMEVVARVNAETALAIGPDDVAEVARFLAANQLVRAGSIEDTRRLARLAALEKPSWLTWLLHHYLFFRIPLVRPDRALAALAPSVGWLARREFRLATLAALALGLGLLIRQWDRFAASLADSFNWQGAAAFGAALALAKLMHELAHALTAKRLGCRVGTMGLAFLVMWPVLYTDVNESWLLPKRRDRLAVGAAGVLAELTLAAWATLLWGILPDGLLRQGALALATTTWVSSVFLNLSPFMRFDGYFLLMDALDLPNLHPRAFALARWQLRELLFSLGEPPPERFPPARRRTLVAFAWAVWTYRLVVFLGIAALVYHFFVKAVGIVLFAVEVGWFVALPIWRELADWKSRGAALWTRRRSRASLALVGVALTLAAVPVDVRVSAPAIFQAAEHESLFAPAPAVLDAILAADGQSVAAGTPLFRLSSPDLIHQRDQAARRITTVKQALGAVGFDATLQSQTQSLREQLQTATAQRQAAERELARLTVTAPVAGTVAESNPNLTPGQWVSPKTQLAAVVGGGNAIMVAYVGEGDVERITEGAEARFLATAPGHPPIVARVVAVERTALLHLDAPALASIAGGPIAIRAGDRDLTPEQAVYRVRLATRVPASRLRLSGTIHIDAPGASLVGHLWRTILGVLLRESGM